MSNQDAASNPPPIVPPDAPGAVFHPTPGASPLPSPPPAAAAPANVHTPMTVEKIVSAPTADVRHDKALNASGCPSSLHIPTDGTLIHTAGTGKPPRLMVYDVEGHRLHAHHLRPARRQEKLTRMLKDLFKRHDESDGSGDRGSLVEHVLPPHEAHKDNKPPSRPSSRLASRHGSPPSGSGSQDGSPVPSSGASSTSTAIHRSNSEELDRDAADAVIIANRGDKPPSLLSVLASQLRTKDSNPDIVLNEILTSRKISADPSLADRYGHLSSVVGKGSFGVVRLAQKADPVNKNRKLIYAVKEFHPNSHENEAKHLKRLVSEFCLASSLHHINIIQTIDLLKDGKNKFCGVMEYCAGGDLYSLIVVAGRLEYTESDCFFKQIMRGVAYMHDMGVAHRDLKPENVLLTSRGCCKLTDFGNAECFRMAWEKEVHMSTTLAGSGPYIAPEEYTKSAFDPRAVDVWAAGVIYMAMTTGRHLWHEAKKSDTFFMKYLTGRKDEHGYEPIERLKASKRRNVIYSVLDPVANRRLTAKQVLNSEWSREIVVCEAGEGGSPH